MNAPNPPGADATALADLVARVKKLEDVVFGPPDFGTRLAQLDKRLAELEGSSANGLAALDKKISDLAKILAELRSAIAARQLQRPTPG